MAIEIKRERLLIHPKDIKSSSKDFEVLGVLNPGALRLPNGNIVLYLRVTEKLINNEDEKYCYSPRMIGRNEFKIKIDKIKKELLKEYSDLDMLFHDGTKRLKFISHFRRVVLDKSGFKILSIDKKPTFYGIAKDGELGVEDPRITKIYNYYVMTYVSLTQQQNISTSIAFSRDGMNWTRKGIIFGEQDKDVVIFPEKVHGRYVAFDRPEGNFQFSAPHIWIAYSKDLLSWGDLKPIGCVYEIDGYCPRNGAGPPPIKTKKGWLLIYHTVLQKEEKVSGVSKILSYYLVGASLFDINNPEKMIAKTKKLIIEPYKKYDKVSFEDKRVIFPSGLVVDKNGKDLLIYSGEGDVLTTVKKVSLDSILKSLKKE